MAARDRLDGLKCQVPGCRSVIRAWTGLQELDKLRRHMKRVHLASITMNEALELRGSWEDRDQDEPLADGAGGR